MGQTLSERLTAQFSAWERRGRGWQVWSEPVLLEPPFVPFRRDDSAGLVTDDAHTPGLAEAIEGLFKRKTEQTPAPSMPPEPMPITDPEPVAMAALRLRLPPKVDVSPELAERLVLALVSSTSRVSFELVGSGAGVGLQFAVARSDAPVVAPVGGLDFPEAS